jgi:hypothetical protein
VTDGVYAFKIAMRDAVLVSNAFHLESSKDASRAFLDEEDGKVVLDPTVPLDEDDQDVSGGVTSPMEDVGAVPNSLDQNDHDVVSVDEEDDTEEKEDASDKQPLDTMDHRESGDTIHPSEHEVSTEENTAEQDAEETEQPELEALNAPSQVVLPSTAGTAHPISDSDSDSDSESEEDTATSPLIHPANSEPAQRKDGVDIGAVIGQCLFAAGTAGLIFCGRLLGAHHNPSPPKQHHHQQ